MVSLRAELFKLSERENSITKVPYFSSRERERERESQMYRHFCNLSVALLLPFWHFRNFLALWYPDTFVTCGTSVTLWH